MPLPGSEIKRGHLNLRELLPDTLQQLAGDGEKVTLIAS
jgi:hypothetical protein